MDADFLLIQKIKKGNEQAMGLYQNITRKSISIVCCVSEIMDMLKI